MLGTTASMKPSWEPRSTLPSGGSPTLRLGYSLASISAAPESPSISSRLLPISTEVMMSSRSKLTFTSIKVTNRSANCCISVRSRTASGWRDSQKAPIRSRMASPPKPSITQKRALCPATHRSRHTMSQLRPAPSASSNHRVFSS